MSKWQPLGDVAPTALTEARLASHWAAQILSATADAAIDKKPDDSHSNVEWQSDLGALVGHLIADRLRVGLRLGDLTLLIIDDSGKEATSELALDGQTMDQGIAWVTGRLGALLGKPLASAITLRGYEMPQHPAGQGKPFAVEPIAAGLTELARWFDNADGVLRALRQDHTEASPVACWPHHFDIATLLVLDPDKDPEEGRSIGVGLSPGDGSHDEPYWYVTHWPKSPESDRPALGHGQWAPFGAVLPGSQLLADAAGQDTGQHELTTSFVHSAMTISRSIVTRSDDGGGASLANLVWYKVAAPDELPEGRVKTVNCGLETLCLTHYQGKYAALDNRCPHQKGPLGEGSIENGYLRCPWHGWDFDPLTGKPPGGYDDGVDTFDVDVRDDGVYVGLPAEPPHEATVSDVMAETMVNWGVDVVFGMVGHSNLGLADALRRLEVNGKLRYYGIRHEGAAAFAASGYGKLTGRPAACLAIAGPGATNLLTGLWDANVDRAPALALTGQVDTQVLGRGAFQEIDQKAAFGKVAQFGHAVLHESKHTELMTLAIKSSLLNRAVSHLIFPDEVQVLKAPADAQAGSPEGRITPQTIAPPPEAVDKAIETIRAARRPVIIVGHGARFAMPAVTELAEMLKCPVLTTFKGKGLISDRHPNGCGVLGRSGTPIASWFMNESDALIVLGSSFSNHTGITPKKPIVQVDFDAWALGRVHPVDVPVWGEIGVTMGLFKEKLASGTAAIDQRPEIAERWTIWRTEKARREDETGTSGVHSASIFAALTRTAPKDAIIAVDVGNNTYSFGRYFECTSQAVLMSGYLGSIGFAFPAAMGAWAATQGHDPRFTGRQVISISGDGGFGQYMGEITTAVKYNMNITHVLLNNHQLGKISKEQRAGNWHVWQTSLHNPSFAAFAKLCGAQGIRVRKAEELDDALTEALEHDGPSMVEIDADAALI